MEESTGERPAGLEQPEIDPDLFGIVDIFWTVRGSDGLALSELAAYTALTGEPISQTELRFLRAMDSAASAWLAKKMRKKTAAPAKQPAARPRRR